MIVSELNSLLLQAVPVAFLDLMACAALGAAIIAFVCECAATISKKSFLDKYAQQLTALSLWGLLIAVLAGGGALFVAGNKLPGLNQWLLSETSPALPFGATLGFTLFSLALYKANWRNLRQNKGPHLYLGAFAALGSLASVYAGMATANSFAARFLATKSIDVPLLWLYAPNSDSLFWPLLIATLMLCLSYGGGLGAAYLVHRRTRDNFGRDYYNYALSKAAFWGLIPLAGFLGALGWLGSKLPAETIKILTTHPLACYAGSALGLALLAALCWLPVALSKHPLRLKWLTLTAALLLLCLHALLLTLLVVVYPNS